MNPLLVLVLSMFYSTYTDRLAHDRLMIAAVLLPVPLIVLLRLVILLGVSWVYFFLYAFVLAYGVLLMLSWSVYLAIHYDIQEAKRLVPFISSGTLLGAIVGGLVVVFGVRLTGPGKYALPLGGHAGGGRPADMAHYAALPFPRSSQSQAEWEQARPAADHC